MEDWYKKTADAAQETVDLLHDAYRMVLQFSAGMRRSSGYIYTSAIPYFPPGTLKRQYSSAATWDYVIRGQPSAWDTCIWSNEDMDVVWSLSYSTDDGRIVTGDRDGVVHVFDAITGVKQVQFEGRTNMVLSVAFSTERESNCFCTLGWDRQNLGYRFREGRVYSSRPRRPCHIHLLLLV